jgi:hypothetical protein
MNSVYYKKYLKYKYKYLQLGGKYRCDPNVYSNLDLEEKKDEVTAGDDKESYCSAWYNLYKILYNEVLTTVESGAIDPANGIIAKLDALLSLRPPGSLSRKANRILEYNLRFIICIISILMHLPGEVTLMDTTNLNKEKKLNDASFYYMEDCYDDNIVKFYSEYENLRTTGKSAFFYRSNLVNISILLKCFNDGCIDKIEKIEDYERAIPGEDSFQDHFYLNLKEKLAENPNYKEQFFANKYKLLRLLLLAYKDFDYEKVKSFYVSYLEFYEEPFKTTFDYEYIPADKLKAKELIDIIKESHTSSLDKPIIYLSCILSSKPNFFRFSTVRMLIGYLGMRKPPDGIMNSIQNIHHDFFYNHHHVNVKQKMSNDDLNRAQILLLGLYKYYDNDKDILDPILELLQNNTYEPSKGVRIREIIRSVLRFDLKTALKEGTYIPNINFLKFVVNTDCIKLFDDKDGVLKRFYEEFSSMIDVHKK